MTTASPEPLDPSFQRVVEGIAAAIAAGVPEWETMTAQQIRASLALIRRREEPLEGVSSRDLVIGIEGAELPARLYVPDGAPAVGPGLVYFHGGGFAIGDIDTHHGLVERLAKASGVKVLSVNYRLAPEYPFPTAHEDTVASAKWAFDHAAEIGFDPTRIAIGGDSAGANLASSACLALRGDAGRKVKFQLLFYPNTTINDPSSAADSSRQVYKKGYFLTLAAAHHLFSQYVSAEQAGDPRIDLLNRSDLVGLPPTFFSVGHCDILFDEGVAYAEAMKAAGVDVQLVTYPGYIHSFYGFYAIAPVVMHTFDEAGAALAAGLG